MTDVTPQPAALPAAPDLLRQARETAGLHIAALAAALKVPVRKLEALEAGQYDELPDLTFARALASSACRHLRVDPAPVLAQIPHRQLAHLGDSGAINAPFKPGNDEPVSTPWGWLSRPAVLVAIALLLGALVIVFMPSVTSQAPVMPPVATAEEPAPSSEPEPPAVLAGPGTVTEPLVAPQGAAAEVAPASSAPSVATVPPVAVPVAPASPAPVVASVEASAAPVLSITAKADTWLEVSGGASGVLAKRMLKAGETVDFRDALAYSVLLGRADGAEVKVRGRAFDLTPHVRNSVARFEVN